MTRLEKEQQLAKDAARQAVAYLRRCGIRVPRFVLTTEWSAPIGGSAVYYDGRVSRLNLGRYPNTFLRNWLSIHEVGHILWNEPNRSGARSSGRHSVPQHPKITTRSTAPSLGRPLPPIDYPGSRVFTVPTANRHGTEPKAVVKNGSASCWG